MKGAAWEIDLVVTRALNPQASAVRLHQSSGDGQTQARASPLEFNLAARVKRGFSHPIEFLKDAFPILWRDADTGVTEGQLNVFGAF